MITLPKEHNEVFFDVGCLDLSAVCYTDPKGNLWNSIMGGDVIDEKHYIDSIMDFVKKHSDKRLYCFDKYEAHNQEVNNNKKFRILIELTKEGKLDIIFGGAAYSKVDYPFKKINYWLGNNIRRNQKLEPRKFEKHFLYMNRFKKRHRWELFQEMYINKSLDYCHWSWASDDINDPFHKSVEGIPIDDDNSYRENDILKEFKTSFCSIVTETFYNVDNHTKGVCFPTEKTEKCFVAGQPFIMYSTPYYLEGLKQLGFKTFSAWIDESYDKEVNPEKRRDKILGVINKLKNQPLDKLEKWYKEMIPTLEHNQKINTDFGKRKNRAGWSFVHGYSDIEYSKNQLIKHRRPL